MKGRAAIAEWARVAAVLAERGLLDEFNRGDLVDYVMALGELRTMERELEVRRETGGTGRRQLAADLRQLRAWVLEAAERLGCEVGDDDRIVLPLHLLAAVPRITRKGRS